MKCQTLAKLKRWPQQCCKSPQAISPHKSDVDSPKSRILYVLKSEKLEFVASRRNSFAQRNWYKLRKPCCVRRVFPGAPMPAAVLMHLVSDRKSGVQGRKAALTLRAANCRADLHSDDDEVPDPCKAQALASAVLQEPAGNIAAQVGCGFPQIAHPVRAQKREARVCRFPPKLVCAAKLVQIAQALLRQTCFSWSTNAGSSAHALGFRSQERRAGKEGCIDSARSQLSR